MLKSITEYLELYTYDYNKEPLNEELVTPTLSLISIIISTTVFIVWNILTFVLSSFEFKRLIKKRTLNEEYTTYLREITKDNFVTVYITKGKEPNAFMSTSRDCYITKPLFDMLTKKERIAILLHEYAHIDKNHIIKVNGVDVSVGILSYVTMQTMSLMAFGFFIPFVNIIVRIVSSFVANMYSRIQEYRADDYVVKMGYSKELSSALKKLEKWVKSEICVGLKRKDCESLLEEISKSGTHPTIKSRIEKILSSQSVQKFMISTAIGNFSREKVFEKIKTLIGVT